MGAERSHAVASAAYRRHREHGNAGIKNTERQPWPRTTSLKCSRASNVHACWPSRSRSRPGGRISRAGCSRRAAACGRAGGGVGSSCRDEALPARTLSKPGAAGRGAPVSPCADAPARDGLCQPAIPRDRAPARALAPDEPGPRACRHVPCHPGVPRLHVGCSPCRCYRCCIGPPARQADRISVTEYAHGDHAVPHPSWTPGPEAGFDPTSWTSGSIREHVRLQILLMFEERRHLAERHMARHGQQGDEPLLIGLLLDDSDLQTCHPRPLLQRASARIGDRTASARSQDLGSCRCDVNRFATCASEQTTAPFDAILTLKCRHVAAVPGLTEAVSSSGLFVAPARKTQRRSE